VFFGLLNYMSVLVDHSGADAWVMSANFRNADSGDLISGRYIDRIVGLPDGEWVEPLLIGNGLFKTPDRSTEPVRVIGTRTLLNPERLSSAVPFHSCPFASIRG